MEHYILSTLSIELLDNFDRGIKIHPTPIIDWYVKEALLPKAIPVDIMENTRYFANTKTNTKYIVHAWGGPTLSCAMTYIIMYGIVMYCNVMYCNV